MLSRLVYRPHGEVNRCPSCKGPRLENLDLIKSRRHEEKGDRLAFVAGCRSCGLIFVNPPPSKAELAQMYSATGQWNQERNADTINGADDDDNHDASEASPVEQRYAQLVQEWAAKLLPGQQPLSVLDFGCGRGPLLDLLKDAGFLTYGLDPATRHLVHKHKMLEAIPAEPTFDIVVSKHVFEHVPDPMSLMVQLRQSLKPGGFLLCGMPSMDELTTHKKLRYCINWSHHITAYTRQSLTALLTHAGFVVEAFPTPTRSDRLICVATSGVGALPTDPLSDARVQLRAFRKARDGRLRQLFPKRILAALQNARRI